MIEHRIIKLGDMVKCITSVVLFGLIATECLAQCPVTVSPSTAPVRCDGGAITFTASGGSNYRWYEGTPDATPEGTGSTFTVNTSGNYFLVATGSCGQEQSVYLTATVSTNPAMPSISAQTVSYNTGAVFRPFNADLLPTNGTYRWYASDQTTLLSTGVEFYTGSLTSSKSYYVSTWNGSCESAKVGFTANVVTLPVSNAGADVSVNLPSSTASITGTASGLGLTLQWFQLSGPSVTMSGTNTTTLTLTNITAGSYVFRLQVLDAYGQQAFDDVVFQANSSSSTNNYNYTRKEDILVRGVTNVGQASGLPVEQKQMLTTYLDELGRPMEAVGWKSSPGKYDGVQPVFYDALGREEKSYLGTVSALPGNGEYKKTLNANGDYNGVDVQNLYNDKPYALAVFEKSPLGRIVEQGSEGQAWQPGSPNGTTLVNYGANAPGVVRQWTINTSVVATGVPNSATTWTSGSLKLKTVQSFSAVSEVYEDGLGQKLLDRVKIDATNWAETYYVYDAKGNLRFIIPPALSKELKDAGDYNITQAQADRWCYQNIYDNLGRVIESKSPGTGWVHMVYDKRNRLVLQQDALQRQTNVWEFVKYDELNRTVMSGLYRATPSPTRAQLQTAVDGLDFGRGYLNTTGFSYDLSKILTGTDIVATSYNSNYKEYQATSSISFKPGFSYSAASGTFAASIGDGQSQWDNAFPNKNVENLEVMYYDDYSGNATLFGDAAYQFSTENFVTVGGENFLKTDRTLGMSTGSMVKVLGSNQWLQSVRYYGDKLRPIQTISSNHLGFVERESILYDYTGKILERKRSSRGSYAVEWKELLNVVVESSGTILRKSSGATAWGVAGAASGNELPAGDDGWVETTALETNKSRMFGLSENNVNAHYNTIDYAIHLNATSQAVIYQKVDSIGSWPYAIGDKFRIERVGPTIYYKKNGSIIYQSTVPSATRLIVDCTFRTVDAKLDNTVASFGALSKSPSITQRYTYDHAGRLLKTFEKFNSQPEIIKSSYEYDELGKLKDEKLHSADNGSTYLQSIDYAYNVKGWLTRSNSASGSDPGETDYFGYELAYDTDVFSASSTPRKDGNITATKWRNDLGTRQRMYTYDYTLHNLLSGANYKSGTSTPWGGQPDYYSEKNLLYDYNGNITKLKRNQKKDGYDQQELIDDLTYTYSATSGNQLVSVSEGSVATGKTLGFNDGNTSGDDYGYDVNGNLTFDKNKGIIGIIYNVLNLQERITFNDNSYMLYKYAASGVKLSQTYYNASNQPLVKTDYAGSQVFVNDEPVVMFHSEGRLLPPAYSNLVSNKEANGPSGFSASLNVTLSSVTQAGETYVKVVSNQATDTPGVLTGTYNVKPGERYAFKVLGYRDTSHPAYLVVKSQSGANLVWMSAILPQGSANENWTTVDLIVPAGVTQITPGVLFSTPAVGATLYVNRVALYKVDWEYQYFLTDQLGSTRAVLSTTPSTLDYKATFETEHQVSGANNNFTNVDVSKIAIHPSNTTVGGDEVIAMNNTYRIGPSRSLKVYPGDKVDASVSAYYDAATGLTKTPSSVMASALITVLTGNPITVYDGGAAIRTAYTNSENSVAGFGLSSNNGASRPSAFLNYILFDENYTALEAKSVPVGSTAGVTHTLSFSSAFGLVNVKQPGYMFVYLSYDNENTHPVYFDELEITHEESPLVQVNDYYSYGMTSYSWTRDGEYENRYLFQGKELDVKTGFQDFQARQYDPTLGRWFANDPKGSIMPYNSNYVAMMNNPTKFVDPDGECPVCVAAVFSAVINGIISGSEAWVNHQNVGQATLKGALVGGVSGVAGYFAPIGILWGTAYGAGTGAAIGAGQAALNGTDIGKGMLNGAITGGVTGGIFGGIKAYTSNANIWSGKSIQYEPSTTPLTSAQAGTRASTQSMDKRAAEIAKEKFGWTKRKWGAQKMTTALPPKARSTAEDLIEIKIKGKWVTARGVTISTAFRKTNIYLAPGIFGSELGLTSTIGHELIHAYHFYMGFDTLYGASFNDLTENTAHSWQINFLAENYTAVTLDLEAYKLYLSKIDNVFLEHGAFYLDTNKIHPWDRQLLKPPF